MPSELALNLPSGETAVLVMSATAGDLFVSVLLLILISLQLFDQVKNLAHLASKRGKGGA
ncbi:MAG: hypothetical protein D6706_02070 [Chloroflexi bacterium]|nr:MAG: hypothetical protein D6706_02070 [Chloroflexota bacterium]